MSGIRWDSVTSEDTGQLQLSRSHMELLKTEILTVEYHKHNKTLKISINVKSTAFYLFLSVDICQPILHSTRNPTV